MKKSLPQSIANAIIKQNKLLADTYVIVLDGIT